MMTPAYVYESEFHYSETYIYMNWGWGPDGGNGYYRDNDVLSGPPVYSISNRTNLYNIYPNN